jgi:hypothetical protein
VIQRWWAFHPKDISAAILGSPRLIEIGDPLLDHLKDCEAWLAGWQLFRNVQRPDMESKIEKERQWVRQQLDEARLALPTSVHAIEARALIQEILGSRFEQIPVSKLQAAFSNFSPESIKARIEAVDAKLQELSFDAAMEAWTSKLAGDIELQASLDQLLRRYERNKGGRVCKEDYKLFETALRALPIWITTAQAPQSLPLQAGLFDLLIIDEATQCTLTNLLPLVYRAKRIAVIGDKEQLPAIPTLSSGAEQALARTFSLDDALLDVVGHAQNTIYSTFVQCLPVAVQTSCPWMNITAVIRSLLGSRISTYTNNDCGFARTLVRALVFLQGQGSSYDTWKGRVSAGNVGRVG